MPAQPSLPDLSPLPPKGELRVVHTADWHLGKSLGNLDRLAEAEAFLLWLAEFLREAQADALVIAGDLFDSATPPQAALRLYYEFLATLHAQGRCRVILTAGNHDSPAVLESPRDLLRVIGAEVVATLPMHAEEETVDAGAMLIPLPSPEAAQLIIAAVPFLRERDLRRGHLGQSEEEISRELREGIVQIYQAVAESAAQQWPGIPVMATGHLTALGASPSESERTIHVGGLGSINADGFPPGFAYIALGHLHRPQSVGGRETIRYAGSPIALSFGEVADKKEIRVLDWLADGTLAQHAVPVPVTRALFRLRLPATGIAAGLRSATLPTSPLPPWAEVVITGANSRAGDDLCREVRDAAKGLPFEVIRVLVEQEETPSLAANEAHESEIRDLLADPSAVFSRRLEAEPLEEEARARLRTAFEELCRLHEERVRSGDA